MSRLKLLSTGCVAGLILSITAGCASQQNADACNLPQTSDLDRAITNVEHNLATGCEHRFHDYFQSLLVVAADNPHSNNRMLMSDHLVRSHEQGVISKRQAQGLYNRYFSVKFVSLQGEYNTCSQTCPVRDKVMSDMKAELQDKELGLMRASADSNSYYRADNLLKETDLVLEATCRACAAGNRQVSQQ
ncbi:MAG: hypothetical protein O3A63_09075 [Proteobacteria bacterium]|nr:hypothetical protein [Pseudomonadota bacterium]